MALDIYVTALFPHDGGIRTARYVNYDCPGGGSRWQDKNGEWLIGSPVDVETYAQPPEQVVASKGDRKLSGTDTAVPKPPNGMSADHRLFQAIIALSDQFAICGLEPPVAIIVKPGQAKSIQAMVTRSVHMLFEDARCGELRIWGIPIREAGTDDV